MLQFPWQEAAPSLSPSGLRVLHCESVRNMQSLHKTEEQAALREKEAEKGSIIFFRNIAGVFFSYSIRAQDEQIILQPFCFS
jgi:hypothetical protein